MWFNPVQIAKRAAVPSLLGCLLTAGALALVGLTMPSPQDRDEDRRQARALERIADALEEMRQCCRK